MTIQQAAISLGLPASTIRYYEKEGIIPPAKRDAGGRRIYSQEDVDRLIPVSCLSATGMSLKDMRIYLRQRGSEPVDQYARTRLELIESQRKQIDRQRQLLRVRLRYLQIKERYWKAYGENDMKSAQKYADEANKLVIRMQD